MEELRCWGLPNPWFTVGKLIITVFTKRPVLTFTIHCELVFWQDPTNMSRIGKAGLNNFKLLGVKESQSGLFEVPKPLGRYDGFGA